MKQPLQPNVLKEIEQIITNSASKQIKDFSGSNQILYVFIDDVNMRYRECATKVNQLFNANTTQEIVKNTIHSNKLARSTDHESLPKFANMAQELAGYLCGIPYQNNDVDSIEKELGTYSWKKRLVLFYFVKEFAQLQKGKCFDAVIKMNKDFAGECLDSIITYIKTEFGDMAGAAEYEKEIFRLEAELKRNNSMLVTLQDEFDARIEENRKEECENLISLLNSAKYGYILDLLTSLQSGIRKLRRAGKQIPIEIGSLQSLVRQLLQFVEDCGITPIMEIGEELTVTADDIGNYQYQGTPFNENEGEKTVVVTSTGWEIKDKELTISLPAVQEKE